MKQQPAFELLKETSVALSPQFPHLDHKHLRSEAAEKEDVLRFAVLQPTMETILKGYVAMVSVSNGQTAITRTERGLTIAGTRITLYDVMDYVTEQYPPKFIRTMLDLTDKQMNAALSYIEAHRAEIEAEYQLVIKEAEALRQYYEEQNREVEARIAAKPPKLGTEAIHAKLQAARAKLDVTAHEFSD